MTDVPTGGKREDGRRMRGVGFPYLPLPEAVKTLTEVAKYGPEHNMSAFAQYLGYESSTGGRFRMKVAAFKDWGLITTANGRVILTQLARDIAQSDDPTAETTALRQAFKGCPIFVKVYEDSAKGTVLDSSVVGKRAVLNLGVSATSRETFTRSLVASAAAAGLAEVMEDGRKIRFITDPDEGPDHAGARGDMVVEEGEQTRSLVAPPVAVGSLPITLRQVWGGTDAQVILEVRSRYPLPASAFLKVAAAVETAHDLANDVGARTAAASIQ